MGITTELARFYLAKAPVNQQGMAEVPYFKIIEALDAYFNKDWTWELVDDTIVNVGSETNAMTTVALYTPGKVYTGRSYCKITDYHLNHLYALLDASKSFTIIQQAPAQNTQQAMPNNGQMTPEQIAAMAGGQTINSAAQFHNAKDGQGRPADEVPFNNITDQAHQELNAEMGIPAPAPMPQSPQGSFGQNMNPPVNPNQQVQQNMNQQIPGQPMQQKKEYTQQQLARVAAFKQNAGVVNDEQFAKWVNTWNPNFTSKRDLTPDNIDDFLNWFEQMGEA